MCTSRTLLSDVCILVKVDYTVRAGIYTVPAAGTFFRIYDNQAVIPFVDSALDRAGTHTGGVVAMHAQVWAVGYLHLGNGAAYLFVQLQPELPDFRLWFCDRRPVIAYMLILAGELAGVTAVTDGQINDKYLLAH